MDVELAVDRDGGLLGLRADVIGDIGAYSIYPWTGALSQSRSSAFCRDLIGLNTIAAAFAVC
jgi:carbon-monoxide dehydrogenase large subunit